MITLKWIIIFLPATLAAGCAYLSEKRWLLSLGGGYSLVLASLLTVAWVDFSPLNLLPLGDLLDWSAEFAPKYLRPSGFNRISNWIDHYYGLGFLVSPSGWLTFFMVVNKVWLGVCVLVLFALQATVLFLILLGFEREWLGYTAISLTVFLMLLTVIFLPEIDSIGERSFPHPLPIFVALLQVKILWRGPLSKILGYLLIIYGVFKNLYESASDLERENNFLFD